MSNKNLNNCQDCKATYFKQLADCPVCGADNLLYQRSEGLGGGDDPLSDKRKEEHDNTPDGHSHPTPTKSKENAMEEKANKDLEAMKNGQDPDENQEPEDQAPEEEPADEAPPAEESPEEEELPTADPESEVEPGEQTNLFGDRDYVQNTLYQVQQNTIGDLQKAIKARNKKNEEIKELEELRDSITLSINKVKAAEKGDGPEIADEDIPQDEAPVETAEGPVESDGKSGEPTEEQVDQAFDNAEQPDLPGEGLPWEEGKTDG